VIAFRLVLEYDGSDFAGWQVQAGGARTVQGCLEAAVLRVTGQPVRVSGSGRTDAGVHARGQVAALALNDAPEAGFDARGLQRALNGVLPPDVAVIDAAPASLDFDPRRDARSKLYVYSIWNARERSPLRVRTHWWVPQALDLAAMSGAARCLTGRHDFTSFQTSGTAVKNTVRTVSRLDVLGKSRGELVIEVEGDGFLRHMVRNIVGTLVEVGRGRRTPESMSAVLAARDRRRAGATAPARGLTLVRVRY